ncbi:MAG: arginine--tRNA ligase [Patescibacteria group bacterium]|nr:arginine--tRNA ligase [Patescibacteria group bacterium]
MKDIILQYIQQHIPEFAENNLPIQIETPPSEEMGDFAVACFPLARTMKQAPNMIAETLAERLQSVEGIIVKNTGPYLNFFIGDALLVENLSKQDTCKQTEKNKKVMVEYSSPNTNKPQHLGHVRNNIIGMAMSSILSHTGYDVVKCNLYNDRGIAICKSMIAYQYLGNGETPESSGTKGDHLVGKYYVLYKELCKKEGEEKIEAETSEMLRKWEAGDRETRQLWQTMTDWVLTGYDQTYQTLGCQFDAIYKESDTYMDGKDIIQEGLEKGIFQTKENGAVFADLSEYKLDEKILQRGDGTSIYITQDLGTTLRKFNEHNLDSATWVVANEQDYHFKVLFALIDKLGYKDMTKSCHHLSYGYIQLPNGRMKSREGTVIDADSLIAELQELCKDAIQSRNLELEE